MMELSRILEAAGLKATVFPPGSAIFERGEPATGIFHVVMGQVKIVSGSAKDPGRVMGVLEAGEIFGEAAFLEGVRRQATALAGEETRLVELPRERLPALIREQPDLAFALIRHLSRKLRLANTRTNQCESATEVTDRRHRALQAEVHKITHDMTHVARRQLATLNQGVKNCMELDRSRSQRFREQIGELAEQLTEVTASLGIQLAVCAREGINELGFLAFLRRRLMRFQVDTGTRIRLEGPRSLDGALDAPAQRTAFTLIEAAVTHAQRVSRARTVAVLLEHAGGTLSLRVEHDGERDATVPAAAESLELLSESARLAGGDLRVAPPGSPGAWLEVRLALEA